MARIRSGQSQRMVRGLVLGVLLAFLAVLLSPTLHAWVRQRDEIEALTAKVATQEADVAELQKRLDRWKDPAYVEQQARQRLKFVRPGERSYVVLDANPAVPTETGPAVPMAAGPVDGAWYANLWSSLRAADTGTEAAGTGP